MGKLQGLKGLATSRLQCRSTQELSPLLVLIPSSSLISRGPFRGEVGSIKLLAAVLGNKPALTPKTMAGCIKIVAAKVFFDPACAQGFTLKGALKVGNKYM